MNKPVSNPYVHQYEDGRILILGEPDGLKALGEILVSKAKLGRNLSATMRDGINPDIQILSSEDILEEVAI